MDGDAAEQGASSARVAPMDAVVGGNGGGGGNAAVADDDVGTWATPTPKRTPDAAGATGSDVNAEGEAKVSQASRPAKIPAGGAAAVPMGAASRWNLVRANVKQITSRKGDSMSDLMPRLAMTLAIWLALVMIGGLVLSAVESAGETARNDRHLRWGWMVEQIKTWSNSTTDVDAMLDSLISNAHPDVAERARLQRAEHAGLTAGAPVTRKLPPWQDRAQYAAANLYRVPEEGQHGLRECADGWLLVGERCFHVAPTPMSHDAAHGYCVLHNLSQLMSVHSQADFNTARLLAPSGARVWLGAGAAQEWEWQAPSAPAFNHDTAPWASERGRPTRRGECAYMQAINQGRSAALMDATCGELRPHACVVSRAQLTGDTCPGGAGWHEDAARGECVYYGPDGGDAPVSQLGAVAACEELQASLNPPTAAALLPVVATFERAVGLAGLLYSGLALGADPDVMQLWTAAKGGDAEPTKWMDRSRMDFVRENATISAGARDARGPCTVLDGRNGGEGTASPPADVGWYRAGCGGEGGATFPLCVQTQVLVTPMSQHVPTVWHVDHEIVVRGKNIHSDASVALFSVFEVEGQVWFVQYEVDSVEWVSGSEMRATLRHDADAFPDVLFGSLMYARVYSPLLPGVTSIPIPVAVIAPQSDRAGGAAAAGRRAEARRREGTRARRRGATAAAGAAAAARRRLNDELRHCFVDGDGENVCFDPEDFEHFVGEEEEEKQLSRLFAQAFGFDAHDLFEVDDDADGGSGGGDGEDDDAGLTDAEAAELLIPLVGARSHDADHLVHCVYIGDLHACLTDPESFAPAHPALAALDLSEFRLWHVDLVDGGEGGSGNSADASASASGSSTGSGGGDASSLHAGVTETVHNSLASFQQVASASRSTTLWQQSEVVLGPGDSLPTAWDFGHACFHAITVLTTIGYGSPAPVTTEGHVLVVVLGLVGIGVTGFLLDTVSRIMLVAVTGAYLRCTKKKRVSLRVEMVIASVMVVLMLIFGAITFYGLQLNTSAPFTLWEAMYFAFVTATTIGFGDYTVTSTAAVAFCSCYAVLVLGLLSLWFSTIATRLSEWQDKKAKSPSSLARKVSGFGHRVAGKFTRHGAGRKERAVAAGGQHSS